MRELRKKAVAAFSYNKASRAVSAIAPGRIEVLDEIHALGGYGPRVISTRSCPASTSSTPSPYSFTGDPSQSSPSHTQSTPLPTYPSDDYTPPHIHDGTPDVQFSAPDPTTIPSNNYGLSHVYNDSVDTQFSVENSFPSTELASNWEKYDYSSYLPTSSDNTVPTNLDAFGTTRNPAPYVPQNVPTVLEELGLGGEWQPVMDYLDL